MTTLQINHIPSPGNKLQFEVQAGSGQRNDRRAKLMPPSEKIVGASDINLLQGLQWYLEEFFKLPHENFQTRANEVQIALKEWGNDCFSALFDGEARNWYRDAWRDGLNNLTVKIVSNDPNVLSWPWEALFSEGDGYIAQSCRIQRDLYNIRSVRPFSSKLPTKQLNILYILSRPYGDQDVGFQTLARPLLDFAVKEKWPVKIDLLRPPTFDQLRTVLDEKKNFYHIVHFDGHGGAPDVANGHDGVLLFEKENDPSQTGDPISAERLSTLLQEYQVPYMVLNACKSATINSNPFASVATSLLKAGAYGVVAMSYNLWVHGAEKFVPAFYRRLFTEGNIAEAIRAGRREMYDKKKRDPMYSQVEPVEFNDWIVPVLYHRAASENILPKLIKGTAKRESRLPAEAQQLLRRDFIGRSGAIKRLEHAIARQAQAGILIHGMAGEGKTTLAKGFLQWLEDTGGLGAGALWFNFEGINSASSVVDTLTGQLFGLQAMAAPLEEKISAIVQALQELPIIIVWDNFESVSGYGGVIGRLSQGDREVLQRILRDLRDGATKILITSRSPETWLDTREVFRLKLDGLQGEDLWQYCNAVVSDLGLTIARNDPEYKPLIDKLQGNPLAIRVILLRLAKKVSPMALISALDKGEYPGEDKDTKRLLQALEVFNCGLDASFAPVLRFIGLHERFVDADYVKYMLDAIDAPTDSVVECFNTLVKAGLCHEDYENGYRIHPATHASLTRLYPAAEVECRAFVDFMGTLCNEYSGKELHEQQAVHELFGVNFRNALTIARKLDMQDDICALLNRLANYAYKTRHFAEAEQLYREYLHTGELFNRPQAQALAYHQLGMVAQERRDFEDAEKLYMLSLEISLKHNNLHDAASTYHQLGIVAEERRDFEDAEKWYRLSLEIKLKHNNLYGAASTYHQLGVVAQLQRHFKDAEKWYKLSLEIALKHNNLHGVAITYHQLGRVAQEQRHFEDSEKWYRLSLEVKLKHNNLYGAASTYHQLGRIAQERQHFKDAERWYRLSLEIMLKYNNLHDAASTYHQLGSVAQKQRHFKDAEKWYRLSLEIKLKYNNLHDAASNYAQLGTVAFERQNLETAEALMQKAHDIFIKNDPHNAEKVQRYLQHIKSAKEESNQ